MAFRQLDIRKYSIESGIAIAPRRSAKHVYPFATMEVGDSFPLVDNTWQEVDRVRVSVQYWQKRHAPMKFAVRMIDPASRQYRCWRIA